MIAGLGAIDFGKLGGAFGDTATKPATAATEPTMSFASVMNDLATRTVDTLEHAEKMSVQGIQGQADAREVVDAVMSAEQALQAAVAIRDKIVSAYMEISRMSI
ncbi:MAG: flagellar hook-basal body complex protein FliE [Hyphomicrobiales bacterium]|nr:flagellar hook-basal body complex protein FliE [Hyphomicrobiales bacterium]